MFKVLIVLENQHLRDCLDLIDLAQKLAKEDEELKIYGVGVDLNLDLDKKEVLGLDYIINIINNLYNLYDAGQFASIIEKVQRYYDFDCILVLASSMGKMIAPRLAIKLEAGLVADITDVDISGDEKLLVRPAYSGSRLASISCKSKPLMASVRPSVFQAKGLTKIPRSIEFCPQIESKSTVEFLSISQNNTKKDITKSKILVAGGAGVLDHFDQLAGLAYELGGQVAASRKVVDAKKATRDIQVGQSGKTVSPELYIALGIHGTLQHVVGLKNVNSIISVNTNTDAPINSLADIVVEGDACEFVQRLTEKIKENRN